MKLLLAIALVTISGFIALSYEIVWFRVFNFMTYGAAYGFAFLLGSYLMGIALGARFSEVFCTTEKKDDASQMRLVAGFIFFANFFGFLVAPLMANLVAADIHFGLTLFLIMGASTLLGAQFPIISHFGIPADALAGARLSYLYLGNIVGCVLGSLATGFFLFDHTTLQTTAVLLGVLGCLVALAVFALSTRKPLHLLAALVVTVIAAGGMALSSGPLFDRIYEKLQLKHEYDPDGPPFKFVVETKSGVITVDDNDIIYGGGVFDGRFDVSMVDYAAASRVDGPDGKSIEEQMIIRPYSVGALHPEPKEALMIGLASGSWAVILANHPSIERLTIIEINAGYNEIIAQYPTHAPLLTDPRVELHIDDGRRWMNRFPERKFDVIVANTTFHWRAGSTALLSTEFMDMILARLNPGGIYLFNTTGSARSIRTALDTFPHAIRVINTLVGSNAPIEVDTERWRRILENYTIYGEPALDLSQAAHRDKVDEMIAVARTIDDPEQDRVIQFENHESLKRRFGQSEPITEDNMGHEWSFFGD